MELNQLELIEVFRNIVWLLFPLQPFFASYAVQHVTAFISLVLFLRRLSNTRHRTRRKISDAPWCVRCSLVCAGHGLSVRLCRRSLLMLLLLLLACFDTYLLLQFEPGLTGYLTTGKPEVFKDVLFLLLSINAACY